MSKTIGILITCLGFLLAASAGAEAPAANKKPADAALPGWQVLEFEEKAYWATAKSRLELLPSEEDAERWDLEILSSVVNNSEEINLEFDGATGRIFTRSRLSRGSGQRMKSYQYEEDSVLRERRNRLSDKPPEEWPVSSSKSIAFPDAAADTLMTSPYLLILLAQRLQAQGLDKSTEVLVHTDQNFYRVRLTSGRGLTVEADYKADGNKTSGKRDTRAVAVQVSPEGKLSDDEDFSLLGLQEDVIIFFDKESGLPLQVRGKAPRIGATKINLRSVTMRQARQ